jgi:hypothetical protein
MLAGSLGAGVALYLFSRFGPSAGTHRGFVVASALIVLLVSALVVHDWLTWRRLRRVAVDDQFLYVADYGGAEEVAIPWGKVVRVTQWRGRTLRPVTIHLGSPPGTKQCVRFQPRTVEWGWALSEDKVVGELRELANLRR